MIQPFAKYYKVLTNAVFMALLIMTFSLNSAEAENPTNSNDSYINKIASWQTKQEDRFIPIPRQGMYNVIFEACAGSNNIIIPEAIIISDSDSKKVKLSNNLNAEKCQISSVKIMASNSESITGSVIESGGMAFYIKELEVKIAVAKDNLQTEKINLKTLVEQKQNTIDHKNKVYEITDNIVKLKKDLNDSRELYNRVLYLLYK